MIYLDNAATTPVPAAVADAMYEVLTQHFGNPSSQYPAGQEMKKAVEGWRASSPGRCTARRSACTSPPAARNRTTGPYRPPSGRDGTSASTSSPPPWSTAPCWSRAAG